MRPSVFVLALALELAFVWTASGATDSLDGLDTFALSKLRYQLRSLPKLEQCTKISESIAEWTAQGAKKGVDVNLLGIVIKWLRDRPKTLASNNNLVIYLGECVSVARDSSSQQEQPPSVQAAPEAQPEPQRKAPTEELEELRGRLAALETRNAELETRAEKAGKRVQELEGERNNGLQEDSLRAENTELKLQLDELRRKLASSEAQEQVELDKCRFELGMEKKRFAQRQAECEQLEMGLKDAQKTIEVYKSSKETLHEIQKATEVSFGAQKDELEKAIKGMREEISQIRERLVEREGALARAKEDSEHRQADLDNCRGELTKVSLERAQLASREKELSDRKDCSKLEVDLKEALETLEARKTADETDREIRKANELALEVKVQELERTVSKSNDELTVIRGQLGGVRDALRSAEAVSGANWLELANCRQESKKVKQAHEACSSELAKAQSEKSQMIAIANEWRNKAQRRDEEPGLKRAWQECEQRHQKCEANLSSKARAYDEASRRAKYLMETVKSLEREAGRDVQMPFGLPPLPMFEFPDPFRMHQDHNKRGSRGVIYEA